ncbi:XRE family transcriptional regulator [Actinokineospora sp. NBRC 105648]|uniref:XRE family transcriptional regulator n=1 Tax=Actinokineospora sp. NBRC 105648 TaxID=3032206 RepID=UPI0024A003AE|nr:XRE family transcriptional regulator [Actinokineospora sp. NBRC 105648]GLZ43057.1 hypothetical protein Acsp05_66810 [Actinokineospora sp. NBRC 105648]
MVGDLPVWALRIRALREARGWTQVEAVKRLRAQADGRLPDPEHLVRRWKAWESAENKPGRHYAPLVAAVLGTVTGSLFAPERSPELLGANGMDTLEIVSRLRASDVDDATLHALRITVDKLCSDYAHGDPGVLLTEGRQWLGRIVEMQQRRLGFRQRRESLELAGWLALLVGCVEYDRGDRRAAEATRRAAMGIGDEIDHGGIRGWAHEMRAWFALTTGDYQGTIAAAQSGQQVAGEHSVSVQLLAQEARAWARIGRPREMRSALERGRELLESLPYPDNIDNHFVVDPAKYDFYVMHCHRHVGDDRLARTLADDVIRAGTDPGGRERAPMRIAEARITLAVAAAREGDLDAAVGYGHQALAGDRQSLPSLAASSQDLATALTPHSNQPEIRDYLARLSGINQTG